LASVLLAFVFTGCARKSIITCGTAALMSRPSIESKILSLKTVGTGNTSTAYISGTVLGKDSADNKARIDTLMYAPVYFISHERQDTATAFSDMQGTFEKHLPAGTYDIVVKYVAYTALKIKNVPVAPGELKELDVLLGQQGRVMVESVVDAKN
jgi:hypothetical protein